MGYKRKLAIWHGRQWLFDMAFQGVERLEQENSDHLALVLGRSGASISQVAFWYIKVYKG